MKNSDQTAKENDSLAVKSCQDTKQYPHEAQQIRHFMEVDKSFIKLQQKSMQMENVASDDSTFHSDTPEDDSMKIQSSSNKSQARQRKKNNQFRNFWNREMQPRLTSDIRSFFFLKFMGTRFSGELFRSLPYLWRELNLSQQDLNQFHNAVIQVFHDNQFLQQRYPVYFTKLSLWCSLEHRSVYYKGKRSNKWKLQIEALLMQEKARLLCDDEDCIKKKIHRDPDINAFVQGLQNELEKKDIVIQNLQRQIGTSNETKLNSCVH